MAIPLTKQTPKWAAKMVSFSVASAMEYFPLRVHAEDAAAFIEGTPYVIGELKFCHIPPEERLEYAFPIKQDKKGC